MIAKTFLKVASFLALAFCAEGQPTRIRIPGNNSQQSQQNTEVAAPQANQQNNQQNNSQQQYYTTPQNLENNKIDVNKIEEDQYNSFARKTQQSSTQPIKMNDLNQQNTALKSDNEPVQPVAATVASAAIPMKQVIANKADDQIAKESQTKQPSRFTVDSNNALIAKYYIQVGVFANAQTALSLKNKLSSSGLQSTIKNEGSLSKVRVGGFATRQEAEVARQKVSELGYDDNFIVNE